MKRLFTDIETSPNITLSWRVGREINLDYANITQERKIICIGYKWEGEKVKVLTWDKHQDDKKMLEKFSVQVEKADELVGHHIDRFDFPWIKTRALFHGLPPLPNVRTVDTLKWSRRLYLNSNRLDYIAKFLGLGAKIKTEFNLWKKVLLDNDRKSLRKMVRYCGWDTELLEFVFHKLQPISAAKSHAGVIEGRGKWSCPKCGSEKVRKKRPYISPKGVISHQFMCNHCGGYYTVPQAVAKQYDLR